MLHPGILISLLLSIVITASACGDDRPPTGDSSIGLDGSRMDGRADTEPVDTGPAAVPDGCIATIESCNGMDDDCDGFIDEGSGADVMCAAGESCVDGECTCPVVNVCGGVCVDLMSDRDNCGTCGNTCPAGQICGVVGCCDPGVDAVDLLFMVDNSNSMTEEQASLATAFPRLITALTTGDANGDGLPDFPAVTDLHVGVVTADMGTGGFRVATCTESNFGDDGILRTIGNTSIAGCSARYPSFLSWRSGDDSMQLATDFGCVATVGTGGCGFEQQLEAVLKALTPATSSTRFVMDSVGQADGPNDGFLRPDSVLGIVVVTDEEDCSAANPELFNPSSADFVGDLNLRCFTYPMAVHPISRYVNGFINARGRSGDVVFTAIAGVPPDLSGEDYGAMLADRRMVEEIDPDNPTRLRFSCNVPGRGFAFPPRRIVQVARELSRRGAPSTVQSICQGDFLPAIEAIAGRVGAVVGVSCGPD